MRAVIAVLVTQALPSHSKLDDAMFWVGALFAFTPIAVALGVAGVVWVHKRKERERADRAE